VWFVGYGVKKENAARPLGLLPRLLFLLSVARQEAFSAQAFPPSHAQRLAPFRMHCKRFFHKSANQPQFNSD
jgi:hypothetical protein